MRLADRIHHSLVHLFERSHRTRIALDERGLEKGERAGRKSQSGENHHAPRDSSSREKQLADCDEFVVAGNTFGEVKLVSGFKLNA